MCAGNYSGGQDTCQGDSGGGLYVIESNNEMPRWIVVGITSYGVGCARKYLPGIYTKVSYFLDWIYDNLVITDKPLQTTVSVSTLPTTKVTPYWYQILNNTIKIKKQKLSFIIIISIINLIIIILN